MSFYTGLQATAASLIGDKGQAMTLHKRTPGAYAPTTGSTTVTEADHSVTGAEFDFPSRDIDGTMIQVGDKRVILSAQGMTVSPDTGDMLTSGTTKRNIVSVKAVSPAGTVVVYVLQVRR